MIAKDNSDSLSFGIESILLEEYKFYSSYFLQMHQDRTGTYNIYVVMIGLLASGLGLLYQFGGSLKLPQLQSVVLILLLFAGLNFGMFCRFTIFEYTQNLCVAKMREIRRIYAQRYKDQVLGIEAVLFLKIKSMSKSLGIFSVSLASMVFAALTGFFMGIATFVEGESIVGNSGVFPLVSNATPYIVGAVISLITLLLLIQIYKLMYHYTIRKVMWQ